MVRQAANMVYFWTSLEAGCDATRRFSHHVAGHHRIYAEGRYVTRKNMPTDIFTVRTENAPTPAIRKSRFSEVHVARADTTSGSVVAVAIPQYPSIQVACCCDQA